MKVNQMSRLFWPANLAAMIKDYDGEENTLMLAVL